MEANGQLSEPEFMLVAPAIVRDNAWERTRRLRTVKQPNKAPSGVQREPLLRAFGVCTIGDLGNSSVSQHRVVIPFLASAVAIEMTCQSGQFGPGSGDEDVRFQQRRTRN